MEKYLITEWKEHECTKHLLEIFKAHLEYVDTTLLSGKLLFEDRGIEQLTRALGRKDLLTLVLSDKVFELELNEEKGEKHE